MESRVSSAKTLRRTKACDACHRRKIRCDAEEGSTDPCTYCVKNGYDCHFTYRPNKWPPSKGYVDGLERRVDYLERRIDSLKAEITRLRSGGAGTSGYVSSESDEFEHITPPREEDEATAESLRELTEKYKGLWLSHPTGMQPNQEPRMYHGRASHMHVLNQQIAELGQQSLENANAFQLRIRPEFRYIDPDFFDEIDLSVSPPTWPEPDLAKLLIDAFFARYNNVFPLLHRPTFMRQYADPAMRLDRDWVAIAFGVFALASKYVDDPRVLPPSGNWYSAGSTFWREMRRVMSELYAPPTLFRLQALVLFIWYFSGSSLFPSAGWALIDLALRYVQDSGMHQKKEWAKRAKAHPFEYEMRKRVFWVLFSMERTIALEMDRSFCLQEDEHDVDLPLELNDAALDLLQQGETNPPGFSLVIATFNNRMRLLSFASRKRTELRAIRRLLRESDVVERERYWLQGIRVKLDHFWVGLADNLKLTEEEKNDDEFLVKALLKLQYHQAQFAMYRGFLSRSKRTTHSSEPILEICSDISASVAHILDLMRQRNLMVGRIHETALGGFIAGTVLLINMWEKKHTDQMEDVEKCIAAIKCIENRWQWPGRVHDVLVNLREVVKITLANTNSAEGEQTDGASSTAVTNGEGSTQMSAPQTNPNPFFFFVASDPSQPTPAPYHSFSPLLPDGLISATSESLFTPPARPSEPAAVNDQTMSLGLGDWTLPGQETVDPDFNDWLNSMLFSMPLPGAASTTPSAPLPLPTAAAQQPTASTSATPAVPRNWRDANWCGN